MIVRFHNLRHKTTAMPCLTQRSQLHESQDMIQLTKDGILEIVYIINKFKTKKQ